MFSVVIPLYNKEKTIERAIRSVLNQTVQTFEIVVVNDGSTDGSNAKVEKFTDQRIRLIHQENAGVSAARNRGIAEARLDLIAFLDADDQWKATYLETVRRLNNHFPRASVFATSYQFCERNGNTRAPVLRGIPATPWEGILEDYFAVAIRSDPPLWTSAVTVKRKALLAVGGFPVGVTSGEDLLTWAKLAVSYQIAYSTLPQAVFFLRSPLWGRPTRLYDKEDTVGKELCHLLYENSGKSVRCLRKYLGMWYGMRATTFLKIQEREAALRELNQMKQFSGHSIKFCVYSVLAIMPRAVSINLLQALQGWRRRVLETWRRS